MKLKITFSQLPVPLGTILAGEVSLPITNIEQTYSIIWNLTQGCATTNKFIDLYNQTVETGPQRCSYNIYKHDSITYSITYRDARIRMNTVIETINTVGRLPIIDVTWMLDVDSDDTQLDKLNALHLYFETTAKTVPDLTDDENILIEEINQLVHTLEGGSSPDHAFDFFGSLRIASDTCPYVTKTLPLTDEDYNNFTMNDEWGGLMLDYYRVGKDLFTSAQTDDVHLVKTKALCQQNTVHTAINIGFNERMGIDKFNSDWYDKWCIENNVRDYYDIDLPMFNLGRIALGTIDIIGTTKDEVHNELSKCTSVTNVELIDE